MKTLPALVFLASGLTSAAHAQEAALASAISDAWTGAYAGASVGYAQADLSWTNAGIDTAEADADGKGAVFSLRGGYDHQSGQTVVGGFVEYGRTAISETGDHTLFATDSVDHTFEDYLIVGGRAGRLVGGALIYGTAGFALGNMQTTYNSTIASPSSIEYEAERLSGFMVGIGYERMVGANWSVSTELRYVDFKEEERDPLIYNIDHEIGLAATSLTIGINRRF